jgi:NTP pyrophosphatase (non-canonical NTP hydrolase)
MRDDVRRVIAWAEERGILANSNPLKQYTKTAEESNELLSALLEGNDSETIDAVGDIQVTLILICQMLNIDYDTCLKIALEVIETRKGKMINGVFVKEEVCVIV